MKLANYNINKIQPANLKFQSMATKLVQTCQRERLHKPEMDIQIQKSKLKKKKKKT